MVARLRVLFRVCGWIGENVRMHDGLNYTTREPPPRLLTLVYLAHMNPENFQSTIRPQETQSYNPQSIAKKFRDLEGEERLIVDHALNMAGAPSVEDTDFGFLEDFGNEEFGEIAQLILDIKINSDRASKEKSAKRLATLLR